MLTSLAEAYRRGAQVVHINPLIEAASRRTIVPHEVLAMASFHATKVGTMNVQPRVGGDLALLRGVAKAVLERAQIDPKAIDHEFLQRSTTGLAAYRSLVDQTGWAEIVHQSGVEENGIACGWWPPWSAASRTSRRCWQSTAKTSVPTTTRSCGRPTSTPSSANPKPMLPTASRGCAPESTTGTTEQAIGRLKRLRDLGCEYAILYFSEAAYDRSGIELFEREDVPALS
jgi:hypothetical protein